MSVPEKNIPNIYYFTLARIPGRKAHSIQILRTCDSLSLHGCRVSLLPARRELQELKGFREIRSFYGLKSSFLVKHLPSIDLYLLRLRVKLSIERFFSYVLFISYFIPSLFTLLFLHYRLREKKDVVFVREPSLFLWYSLLKPIHGAPVFFEAHDEVKLGRLKSLYWKAFENVNAIITTCGYLRDFFIKNGAPREKVVVVRHAVDLSMYGEISENKMALRKKLRLPKGSFIVLHAGNLYSWKKPEFIIDALKFVRSLNVYFCNVGGIEEKQRLVEYAKEKEIKNFLFHPRVSPITVPFYLKAADALVLLPAPTSYSPLKLFEYMAAKRPIIAPDNASIREVLTDGVDALLYDPNDPKSLASCILKLIQNKDLARRISKRAYEELCSKYSYKIRARKMLDIMKECS